MSSVLLVVLGALMMVGLPVLNGWIVWRRIKARGWTEVSIPSGHCRVFDGKGNLLYEYDQGPEEHQ